MNRSPGPELTLFLRDGAATPSRARQDAALARARKLVDSGVAADLDVVRWDRKVPVDTDLVSDEETLDAFNAFSDWARRADVRLYPAFQTRECYSWEDGSRYTALVLPVMSLTVETDDAIDAVYPHVDDETEFGVFDGLAILAARQHERVRDTNSEVPAE